MSSHRAVVTGAFSNIGSAVARQLLDRDWGVATLTNRSPQTAADQQIEAHPLRFDREHLERTFAGVDVFVNTYWVRFPYRGVTFQHAVENSTLLIEAARAAGVRRFVQVSVSNASADSPLGYYHGKAQVEELVRGSGMEYGIVRPTLVVGPNDVLTNNIAWFVRRFPFVALPSGPGYRLQPVTLADTGRIVVDVAEAAKDLEIDAAGPEVFTFREYVALLATALGRSARFVTLPPKVMIAALRAFQPLLHDIVLTHDELEGLRTGMLVSHAPPLGTESISDWLRSHGSAFGAHYTNDTLYRFRLGTGR